MGPWAGDGVDNVLRLVTAATAGDVFSLWAGGVVEPQVPGTCHVGRGGMIHVSARGVRESAGDLLCGGNVLCVDGVCPFMSWWRGDGSLGG